MKDDIPKETPDCCDVWGELIKDFQWFMFQEFSDYLAMPCVGTRNFRVNNCPSCGAPQRDCVIRKERVCK